MENTTRLLSVELANEYATSFETPHCKNWQAHKAFLHGYIDKDIDELLKADGKIIKLFMEIENSFDENNESGNTALAMIKLFETAYKAGFACATALK